MCVLVECVLYCVCDCDGLMCGCGMCDDVCVLCDCDLWDV